MKPRFQADANLHGDIVAGVLRREPTIDFQSAQERLDEGMADLDVLALAATEGRILVSHDVNTMPRFFRQFVTEGHLSPGVFLIPQSVHVSRAIDELTLIWATSDAHEWEGLLVWLPL